MKAAQFTNHTKDADWDSVGRYHAYVHCLKRTLGNGRGKLYETGCEGLPI